MAGHSGGMDITETAPDYAFRQPQWRKVRDVIEGEDRIRDRGSEYLPKPRGQNPKEYRNYLMRASFYGVAERTLRGLVGLVFRVEPTIELPGPLELRINALTPEGFTADQSLREAIREVLSLGRYGILVDMGTEPALVGSAVPYLATYRAEDIVNWEEAFDAAAGRRRVTRVVLREEPTTAADKTTTIVRELFIDSDTGSYTQQLWQEVESDHGHTASARRRTSANELEVLSGEFEKLDEPIVPMRGGQPLREIPFWFVNPFDHRARPDKPPMLDMANINLGHWRNSADYEQSLFNTSQVQPFMFGVDEEDVPKSWGSGNIWHSSHPQASAGIIEIAGPGIESLERAMENKEKRMASLGAQIIRDATTSASREIAADTVRLESREETSILIASVQSVEQAFVAALRFAAVWAAASENDVNLVMNQDYVETRMDPQELTALIAAWQSGAISRETMFANLQRGEIVDPKKTIDEERDEIEREEPTGGTPFGGAEPPDDNEETEEDE